MIVSKYNNFFYRILFPSTFANTGELKYTLMFEETRDTYVLHFFIEKYKARPLNR